MSFFVEMADSVHPQFGQKKKKAVLEIKVLTAALEVYFAGQHDCVFILLFPKIHAP